MSRGDECRGREQGRQGVALPMRERERGGIGTGMEWSDGEGVRMEIH